MKKEDRGESAILISEKIHFPCGKISTRKVEDNHNFVPMTGRDRPKSPLIFVAVFVLFSSGNAEVSREWVSNDGKKLNATFVRQEANAVVLRLENNREVNVLLSRLSEADQVFLKDFSAGLVARIGEINPLPEETRPVDDFEVTGGPKTFFTPHFEFTTDLDVSTNFISEAAKIYEGTYEAIKALPHGLPLSPPEGTTHFRGMLMENAAFQRRVQELNGEEKAPTGGVFVGIPTSARTRTVGLYVPNEKALLVPYESLGAKKMGSRLTLRKSSDTSTLVHEIAHQVMHDWLPFVPVWFAEGIAEYIAAVPSQSGRFEFRNAERGLKERLKDRYDLDKYEINSVRRLSRRVEVKSDSKSKASDNTPNGIQGASNLAGQPAPERLGGSWSGSMDDYRDAMLHAYYLIHLADPSEPGVRVGRYLQEVEKGRATSSQIQKDIVIYEQRRKNYNEEVASFNAALKVFQGEVDEYNARVKRHNQQIADGIPAGERVEIGEITDEPTPPRDLVLPDSLKDTSFDRPINLQDLVWRASARILEGDLSGAELDDAMKKAYESIGIKIHY